MRVFGALLVLALSAPSCTAETSSPQMSADQQSNIEQEARAFMDSYARDLLAGDRTAIAERYHPDGAYFIIDGRKKFETSSEIRAKYASDNWTSPVSFEWRDISIEAITSDAVILLATFRWGDREGQPPLTISYNALLRRHGSNLKIRIEDETVDQSRAA